MYTLLSSGLMVMGVPLIQISYEKQNKHRDSQAHNSSVEIIKLKEKGTLPNSFIDIESELLKTTINSFRMAYKVTNERLSYKKTWPSHHFEEAKQHQSWNYPTT